MEFDRQSLRRMMDIVEVVTRREEHDREVARRECEERGQLEARRQAALEADKHTALKAVHSSALAAVERFNAIEWPDGFTCKIDDTTIVLTSLGMIQPLFLGSDGWIYRRESYPDSGFWWTTTFRARLCERKSAGSILHVKKTLDTLAT